jgi:hypothetical protein
MAYVSKAIGCAVHQCLRHHYNGYAADVSNQYGSGLRNWRWNFRRRPFVRVVELAVFNLPQTDTDAKIVRQLLSLLRSKIGLNISVFSSN